MIPTRNIYYMLAYAFQSLQAKEYAACGSEAFDNTAGLLAAILAKAQSPLGDIADLKVLTPPGVGLFGTDASMTRILQMMLNEVLFHCLAVKNVGLLENAQRIDAVLNSEKIGAGDFRRRHLGSEDRDRSEGHRQT